MKIKEVVNEIKFFKDPTAKFGFHTPRSKYKPPTTGAQAQSKGLSWQDLSSRLGGGKLGEPSDDVETPAEQPTQSKFLQQFEIVDDNPVTVQWKNQQFQRRGGTGEWVNFPAGKPVSQQMIDALDRISPSPTAQTKAHTLRPISVVDRVGATWNYNDQDRSWYGANGVKVIVNPTIGDIDYNNGVVDIKNLHITALADLDLEISIRPLSNDVVSALTQIVHIPPEHLKVVAIPDPTASGDLRGGYNYTFTSSRS